MLSMVKRLWSEERGQGMTEYGLILALLVIGVIAVMATLGPKIAQKFTDVQTELDKAPTPTTP